MNLPTSIPKEFYSLFWDVDPEKLNPSEKPYFVIQRMLDWNQFAAAKWALVNFPADLIKKSLVNMRGWDKRSANFWATYLDFDRKELMCSHPLFQSLPQTPWAN